MQKTTGTDLHFSLVFSSSLYALSSCPELAHTSWTLWSALQKKRACLFFSNPELFFQQERFFSTSAWETETFSFFFFFQPCSVMIGSGHQDCKGPKGKVRVKAFFAFAIFLYSAFCILHSAFCILHSAFCILLSAFCFLLSAFCFCFCF